MNDYVQNVLKDSKMILVYATIFMVSFFLIISYETFNEKFAVMVFSLTLIIGYYSYTSGIIKSATSTVSKFAGKESDVMDTNYNVANVFQVQNKPKKIVYIYLHDEIMKVINNLAFIKTFDAYAYDRLIVLLEEFFKTYYKVLNEEYDPSQFYPILVDLRKQILNDISEFYFQTPQFSNNTRGNIYEKIDKNSKKIQAITYRCLKIISHQAKHVQNLDLLYQAPSPLDKNCGVGKLYA